MKRKIWTLPEIEEAVMKIDTENPQMFNYKVEVFLNILRSKLLKYSILK